MKQRKYYLQNVRTKAGFSLVEIALALMVVSVGLVSLVGLIPASLEMNKKAINDSQMGLLGEDLLNGYRAKLMTEPWGAWGSLIIDGTAANIWDPSKNTEVKIGKGSVVYQFISPQSSGQNLTIEDVSARYDLDVTVHPLDPNLLACRLELTPGEFGSTNALVFYTEVYNTDLSW